MLSPSSPLTSSPLRQSNLAGLSEEPWNGAELEVPVGHVADHTSLHPAAAAAAAHSTTWDTGEFILTIARRFVYSQANAFAWFGLIIGNAFSLVWTVVCHLSDNGGHDEDWFIFLEIFLNIAMILEITMRILALGINFWLEWQNLADVLVMALCAIATSYYLILHDTVSGKEAEEAIIADELLIILRSLLHIVRLALFMKNRKAVQFCEDSGRDADFIQFTAISCDEPIEAFGIENDNEDHRLSSSIGLSDSAIEEDDNRNRSQSIQL